MDRKGIPYERELSGVFARLFRRRAIHHVDDREEDYNLERSLVREYEGRVLFELLQNAVDRAARVIAVHYDEDRNQLWVGNDGLAVTAWPLADRPKRDDRRSDVDSICALHVSAKDAAKAIGNKGVGFRSTFAFSDRVDLYSTTADGVPWGIGFTWDRPANKALRKDVLAALDADTSTQLRAAIAESECRLPTFYFPARRVLSATSFHPTGSEEVEAWGNICTWVCLQSVKTERREDLLAALEKLEEMPLLFMRLRLDNPNLCKLWLTRRAGGKTTIKRSSSFRTTGYEVVSPRFPQKLERQLLAQADKLDLPLKQVVAEVAVRCDSASGKDWDLFFGYLPTTVHTGLGVLIHADFYLNNSRQGVNFADSDKVKGHKGYNRRLLERLTFAIVDDLWKRPNVVRRDGFWEALHPANIHPVLLKLVRSRLFPGWDDNEAYRTFGRNTRRLRDLVKLTFPLKGKRYDIRQYRELWRCLHAWIPKLQKPYIFTWEHVEEEIIAAVVASGAPVVPIVGPDGGAGQVTATPLGPGKKGKDRRTIYLRGESPDKQTLPSCRLVNRANHHLTHLRFDMLRADLKGTALKTWSRQDLLRAVPTTTQSTSKRDLRALLRWVIALALQRSARTNRQTLGQELKVEIHGPYWRFYETPGSATTGLGTRLSSVKVPCRDGRWRPAANVLRPDPEVAADVELWLGANDEVGQLDWKAFYQVLQPVVEDESLLREVTDLLGIGGSFPVFDVGEGRKGARRKLKLRFDLSRCSQDRSGALLRMLMQRWSDELAWLVNNAETTGARSLVEQLVTVPWVTAGEHDGMPEGGFLQVQAHAGERTSLDRCWYQPPAGGTRELYMWVNTIRPSGRRAFTPRAQEVLKGLGVVAVGDGPPPERIIGELVRLRKTRVEDLGAERAHSLRAAYATLARALDDSPPEALSSVPILGEQASGPGEPRSLVWCDNDPLILHDDGDHTEQLVAFPCIPVFTIRRQPALASRLGLTAFRPKAVVEWAEADSPGDDLERRIQLRARLPRVLALAEYARDGQQRTPHEMIESWPRMRLLQLKDVWLKLHIRSSAKEVEGLYGKNRTGDVFLEGEDPPTVYFDGDPPLSDFSGVLCQALFGNRQLADRVRPVLEASANDAARWSRMCERHGVPADADSLWEGRLQQLELGDDDLAELRKLKTDVLSQYGQLHKKALLTTPILEPDVFSSVTRPDASQQEITDALGIRARTVFGVNTPILIGFRMIRPHLRAWRTFRRDHLLGLKTWAALSRPKARDRTDRETLLDRLEPTESQLDRLGFSALDHFRAWLSGLGGQRLPETTAHFGREWMSCQDDALRKALVFAEDRPVLLGMPDLSVVVTARNVAPSEMGAIEAADDPEHFIKKARQRGRRGNAGEEAVLDFVIKDAVRALATNSRATLRAVEAALEPALCIDPKTRRPAVSKTAKRLAAVRKLRWATQPTPEMLQALRRLLHVSDHWGNAGFDVLHLATDGPATRIEVKRGEADDLVIYLSENERRRALAYAKDTTTRYAVWVVGQGDKPIDVTATVLSTIGGDADGKVLALRKQGVVGDGWAIFLSTTTASSS